MLPEKLQYKLNNRNKNGALRRLGIQENLIDFSSNDYLGFAASQTIQEQTLQYLKEKHLVKNGSTGSRLLSGNHHLYQDVELQISKFHNSESALIFNSGYTANIGVLSCVPQRNDVVLYDEYCHASIRDGIGMSLAKTYKFRHNDLSHLKSLLQKDFGDATIYVVTESVFSMDGDIPELKKLTQICKSYNALLIVDEAHAVGVFGKKGYGMIQELGIETDVFARIVTFGKALGCHGAAVLASNELCNYLINFSRPFIYTTALSPHSLATIKIVYNALHNQNLENTSSLSHLHHTIAYFKSEVSRLQLEDHFIKSDSAIQSCIISGNKKVKLISELLKTDGFDVKAILSPTVPKGKERLRFCIHCYNSKAEITKVLELLTTFVETDTNS